MKDTSGPAFPTVMIGKPEGGMTLRDYFAAKAMQGYISGVLSNVEMATKTLQAADRKGITSEEYFALKSYDVADAMLRAREAT